MVISEADLRSQLRCPRMGATIVVPHAARLTPAARDFINQWQLVCVDESTDQAADPTECCSGGAGESCQVEPSAPAAVSSAMTRLNAHHIVSKTHRRIKLRTRIDSLQAYTRLAQRLAKEAGEDDLVRDLGLIADYFCEVVAAEYGERPVAMFTLPRWPMDKINQTIADPKATLGIDHVMIDESEIQLQHWLNVVRTQTAEVEISALEAFEAMPGGYGDSIAEAFYQLGLVLYFLQLRLKAQGA